MDATLTPERAQAWREFQWANAVIMLRFRADLAQAGLSLEEFDVLIHVHEAPGGSIALRQLKDSLVLGATLSRSGVTRLLDRLERRRLVKRTLNSSDRRQFDVRITAGGRRLFSSVWPGHADGIRRYFSDHLNADDIQALRTVAAKLISGNELTDVDHAPE